MAVEWDSHVNKKIKRSGSSWGLPQGFISDKTKSGKPKRRLAHSMGKEKIPVTMHFTYTEYTYFKYWYENTCCYGTYSFNFPTIDALANSGNTEYEFAEGGEPQFENISGTLIECKMTWQEV